jgi:hypothetical protein
MADHADSGSRSVTGELYPVLVDGTNVAQCMTVEHGGHALMIKGIADALEGGRRRNAYVRDAEGRPAAFPVYRGEMYLVLDDDQGEREAEAGQ